MAHTDSATVQRTAHHYAVCIECGARCDKPNAVAWAHNHARAHRHEVELQYGWHVYPRIWEKIGTKMPQNKEPVT